MTRAKTLASLALCAFLLSGCSSWLSGDDDKTPLKGDRISVLELQNTLSPDPELQKNPPALPESWVNQFWPQTGGYPGHAMGNTALGASLKEAWSVSVGAGGDRRAPLTAGPVVAEDTIFSIDAAGHVSAFQVSTGKLKWRVSAVPDDEEDKSALGGGLAWAEDRLFVTRGYKELRALNAATGALLWKAALPSISRSAPTVADGRVYTITLDNRLLVFSAADGAPLWNYTGIAEETNLLGAATVAVDTSLAVLPLSSGALLGLRPENGQIVWEDDLSSVRRSGSLSTIADIKALPVIDGGLVFAASYSGRMVALDQVSGKRVWQREVGSAETPCVAGDSVFMITTDQQLVAFSRQSGGIRWNVQLPQWLDGDKKDSVSWTGPVLAGGRLIVAGSSGLMLDIDPKDGKTLKSTKLSGAVSLPPIVAGNTLFILTQNGRLAAYR